MSEIISHAVLLAALIFAFAYGCRFSFRKRGVLFLQIVTCAAGSMMLGELFTLIMLICYGEVPAGFHIGMLGITGCYFFLWSASFGQIDGLGDDRNPKFLKYRLIPLALPAMFAGLYVFDIFSGAGTVIYVVNVVMLIPISLTSYYNFKHLIIPDVDFGILKSMRKYNIAVIILSILSIADILFRDFNITVAAFICNLLSAAVFAALLPIARRGVKKWFT